MGKCILVVEDDDDVRSSFVSVLEAECFTVLEAENGERAIAMIASERPDIVLTDIFMPRADGLEFIQALRANGDRTPIIAISGRLPIDSAIERAAIQFGADMILAKPVAREVLMDAISGLIGTN